MGQQNAGDDVVSVIIPSYNRAQLVRRALRSVLNQTYRNLEIFVVDDCSTDDTQRAVEGFADARVHYLHHSVNLGGAAARNTGIRASTGEFIAFLDSDDEWLPTKLQAQLDYFRSLPMTVGLVYTGAVRLYESGVTRTVIPVHRGRILREILSRKVITNSSATLIRRRVLAEVDGFDESLPAYQDADFWARVAQHSDIDFIPECLVRVHVHSDSVRISNDHPRRVRGREMFYQKHLQQLKETKTSHILLFEMGQIYQRGIGDLPKSRAMYRASLRAKPGRLQTYLHLASTYLPLALYSRLARIRRATTKTVTLRK